MRPGHIHICLFQPEIPQNAGSIGRLAAATQSRLHMVRPLGFSTDDKNLRRAGLDYWPFLDLEVHDDLETLIQPFVGRRAFFSKFATKPYTEMPDAIDFLIFGRETSGLPEWVHKNHGHEMYAFPMFHSGVRSINLANAVSIALYHQMSKRRLF